MKAKHLVLFVLLALTAFMFTACKDEPAVTPTAEGITLTGVVYDAETTQPLEGALVSIATASTRTDESGSFSFKNVKPGIYNVSVSLEGYEAAVVEEVLVPAAKAVEEDAEVEFAPAALAVEPIKLIPIVTPEPPAGILYGNVAVRFFGDDDFYAVPEGTGILAIKNNGTEDPEYFRSEVDQNGDFMFEGLENGSYALALGKFSIEYAGKTFDVDYYGFFDPIPVIDGIGKAGNLIVEQAGVDLAIVSVECISREDAALARDIDYHLMHAGDVLRIEFNKNLDPEKAMFLFEGDEVIGYTEHEIVDNVAYVWHDGIEAVAVGEHLYLRLSVASYDGDTVETEFGINYLNALKLTSTNLYEYDYTGDMVSRFDSMDPIVLVFDEDLPADAEIDLLIQDTAVNRYTEKDFYWEIEGNILRLYGTLPYGTDYWMILKITTADGVVIFNTLNGLKAEAKAGIIISGEDEDIIKFSTMPFSAYQKDDKTSMTNIVIGGITKDMAVYEPDFVIEFNTDISYFVAADMVTATLRPFVGGALEVPVFDAIELEVESVLDDSVIVARIPGEGKALYPEFRYVFELTIDNEELFGEGGFTIESEIRYVVDDPEELFDLLDPNFTNGLDTFGVVLDEDRYDSLDTDVEFKWESGCYNIGNTISSRYAIIRKGLTDEHWDLVDIEFEKATFIDYYYDPIFDVVAEDALEDIDDLSFGGYVDYVLLTFDNDGLLVQSPVVRVFDTVGPELDYDGAVITDADIEKDDFVEFSVYSVPKNDLDDGGEYLAIFAEEDYEIVTSSEISPASVALTWFQDPDTPYQIDFKLDFVVAFEYTDGDITVKLNVSDTSGNKTLIEVPVVLDENT